MSNNVNLNKSNNPLNLEGFKKIVSNHKEIKAEIASQKEEFLKNVGNNDLYNTPEKINSEIKTEIKETITNIATEYQNTEAKVAKYIENILEPSIASNSSSDTIPSNKKTQTYELTEKELEAIAYVCYKEQGSASGAADEASLMANRYELYADKEKYPTLYDYVRDCRWWAKSKSRMDNPGNVSPEVETAVYEVLVEGNRTLPPYVDEHDCAKDIKKASNNGVQISVNNREAYIPGVTVLENKYGAKYTFYAFAGGTGDPMGYTNTALKRSQNS